MKILTHGQGGQYLDLNNGGSLEFVDDGKDMILETYDDSGLVLDKHDAIEMAMHILNHYGVKAPH